MSALSPQPVDLSHAPTPTDRRSSADIRPAPVGVWNTLRHLGPGLIITGSIVGSGELILTTSLGAEAGFTFLWLILLSCFIKVFVQIELARYTIRSGQTSLEAFNVIPGPRWGVSWVVWWWVVMVLASFLQVGGIVGGVGQALQIAWPVSELRLGTRAIPFGVAGWTILVSLSGMLILYRGRYRLIERVTTLLVFLFTFTTVACAILLQWTPYAASSEQFLSGLRFQIPAPAVGTALAMFGITGVGASELIYYPYWCLEKGYARFTGPLSDSPEWAERARAWIRVLKIDAWLSMVVYTVSTAAFYVLGAAVLHGRGEIPSGSGMIAVLSQIYVQTIGPWGMVVFLVGALAVLYSTFFVATASNARVIADSLHVGRLVCLDRAEKRQRYVGYFCLLFPVLCCASYLFTSAPVQLIKAGATVQAVTLPVIAGSTVYLRFRHADRRLRPRRVSDVFLVLAAVGMALVSGYQAWMLLSSLF